MKIVRKLPRRVVLLVVVGLLAASVGAGIALARETAKPIGSGVVVIDTNLAYQGGAADGTGMVLTPSRSSSRRRATATGHVWLAMTRPPTLPSFSSRVPPI